MVFSHKFWIRRLVMLFSLFLNDQLMIIILGSRSSQHADGGQA